MNIKLTDIAQEELKKVVDSRKNTNKDLRIYIQGMGWGGPSFGIALDEPKDEDQVIEIDNLKFLLDRDMVNNFSEFIIDYSNNWLRRGFYVTADRGGSQC